jgi:hypothetical protein
MKRFDYGGCDECSFGQLEESPEGDWMDADEVQTRDLKMAELVRALPHEHGNCAVVHCRICGLRESSFQHIQQHEFAPSDCNCPRGELLSMLGETTNG